MKKLMILIAIVCLCLILCSCSLFSAEAYDGPRQPVPPPNVVQFTDPPGSRQGYHIMLPAVFIHTTLTAINTTDKTMYVRVKADFPADVEGGLIKEATLYALNEVDGSYAFELPAISENIYRGENLLCAWFVGEFAGEYETLDDDFAYDSFRDDGASDKLPENLTLIQIDERERYVMPKRDEDGRYIFVEGKLFWTK